MEDLFNLKLNISIPYKIIVTTNILTHLNNLLKYENIHLNIIFKTFNKNCITKD